MACGSPRPAARHRGDIVSQGVTQDIVVAPIPRRPVPVVPLLTRRMRRLVAIALMLACAAGLAALVWSTGIVSPEPDSGHSLVQSVSPTPAAVDRSESGPTTSVRELREAIDGNGSSSPPPSVTVDRALVVKARSRGGRVSGGTARLVYRQDGRAGRPPIEPRQLVGVEGDDAASATFELDGRSVEQVIVSVPGYGVVARRVDSAEPQVLEFTLQQVGMLRVRVVDSTGHLLPRRFVVCRSNSALRALEASDELHTGGGAVSDDRGVVLFEHAMPGTHRIECQEHFRWLRARLSDVEVYVGQVTDVTLTVPERDQATYAEVVFPTRVVPDARCIETGDVEGYRLFYWNEGEAGEPRFTGLMRDSDNAFHAVLLGNAGERYRVFLGELAPGAPLRAGARRTKPFEIMIGTTLTVFPEWEQ